MAQKNNKLGAVHLDVRKLQGKPDTNLPSFPKAKLEKLIEERPGGCIRVRTMGTPLGARRQGKSSAPVG